MKTTMKNALWLVCSIAILATTACTRQEEPTSAGPVPSSLPVGVPMPPGNKMPPGWTTNNYDVEPLYQDSLGKRLTRVVRKTNGEVCYILDWRSDLNVSISCFNR